LLPANGDGILIALRICDMPRSLRHLDASSQIVVAVTCILFVAALFIKGFGHGVLLEAAVFLVSVKLIIMAYKHSVTTSELKDHLLHLHADLLRIEGLLEEQRSTARR
jgi:hypothetical protein